jgi:hypothetical protein
MRKPFAGVRTSIIHRTKRAIQKHAAVIIALQNHTFVFSIHRIVAHKITNLDAQILRQMLHIALSHGRGSHPAAIGAHRAISIFFNGLRNNLQASLDKIMPLHPRTKPKVFLALLLTKPLDLHEVCNHISIIMEE